MPESPKGTILVVDDEPTVARLVADVLRMAGYEVLVAFGGEDALRICEQAPKPVDLVISDVVMPDIPGTRLCQWLASARRARYYLLMSGFTEATAEIRPAGEPPFPLLLKPFTMPELLKKVEGILAVSPEQTRPPEC